MPEVTTGANYMSRKNRKRSRNKTLRNLSDIANCAQMTTSEQAFAVQAYGAFCGGRNMTGRQKQWYDLLLRKLRTGRPYRLPSRVPKARRTGPPKMGAKFKPEEVAVQRREYYRKARAKRVPPAGMMPAVAPPPPPTRVDPRDPCRECGFVAARCQCED